MRIKLTIVIFTVFLTDIQSQNISRQFWPTFEFTKYWDLTGHPINENLKLDSVSCLVDSLTLSIWKFNYSECKVVESTETQYDLLGGGDWKIIDEVDTIEYQYKNDLIHCISGFESNFFNYAGEYKQTFEVDDSLRIVSDVYIVTDLAKNEDIQYLDYYDYSGELLKSSSSSFQTIKTQCSSDIKYYYDSIQRDSIVEISYNRSAAGDGSLTANTIRTFQYESNLIIQIDSTYSVFDDYSVPGQENRISITKSKRERIINNFGNIEELRIYRLNENMAVWDLSHIFITKYNSENLKNEFLTYVFKDSLELKSIEKWQYNNYKAPVSYTKYDLESTRSTECLFHYSSKIVGDDSPCPKYSYTHEYSEDIITIYPNPSSSNFQIQLNESTNLNSNIRIEVFSVTGRHIETLRLNENVLSYSFGENYPNDKYVVNVIQNNSMPQGYIIIKK